MSSRSTGGRADDQRKISSIKRDFDRLEGRASLTSVRESISEINERLAEFPTKLASYQRRGFLHTRPLKERLEDQRKQWRRNVSKLETELKSHKNRLQATVSSTSRTLARARPGRSSAIASAERAVDGLEKKIASAERELRSFYGDIESELHRVDRDLQRIEWMLEALEQSPEIQLKSSEGPLMAVKTEWHRDGDEGPEGILFLTDQRLLFEQREEVVTKKRFGLFKADSEMVQKLWLDINVSDIDKVEDAEEGGFLGIGKADILELVCSADAPVSRARFHLKGQESSDWRSMIRRAQSGEVAAERDAQVEETPSLTFPSTCPNCTGTLPEPDRGATRIKCEFCGSMIGPVEE
jgi:hypothetical protein